MILHIYHRGVFKPNNLILHKLLNYNYSSNKSIIRNTILCLTHNYSSDSPENGDKKSIDKKVNNVKFKEKVKKDDDDSDIYLKPIKYNHPFIRAYDIVKRDFKEMFGSFPINFSIGSIQNRFKAFTESRKVRSSTLSNEPDENVENTADKPIKKNDNISSSKPSRPTPHTKEFFPSNCDVLIIGGGIVGSSIAYHLKQKALNGLDIVVLEKDLTYKHSSTVLSVGGIRQQFSVPENILLSQYGMEFLRKAPELLAVDGVDPINLNFQPNGYLTLASEAGMHQLKENFELQREMGARGKLLTARELKSKFPWMNTDGVEAGVLGVENEGWFDPWSLLIGLRQKSHDLGVKFVEAEAKEILHKVEPFVVGESLQDMHHIKQVEVKLPNGETKNISFAILIIAAGAWSGEIGRKCGIGDENSPIELLRKSIPIEPRKRYVYCIHSPNGPGLNCPLVIDPNGTYFRREGLGDMYLCGQVPAVEPSTDNLDVDEDFFMENVWPTIANRVPSFQKLKLKSSWAGFYDYNTFDQNGIVGNHPYFTNLIIASGFSGHAGLQQGPGIGRAVTEHILDNRYTTINLERFSFQRILMELPLREKCCY